VSALVVTTKQPERVWVPDLERPEIEDAFDGEVTAINVVTKEEVPSLGGIAAYFEEFHEIEVLAMDVSADGDGSIHFQQIWLRFEDLCALIYDEQRLFFGESAFADEVLLQEGKVGLISVRGRVELVVGRHFHSRCLDIWTVLVW